MTTTLKTCFKCNAEKPIAEFYKHPAMGDGHLGKCKECTRRDVIENRKKKVDYYRHYDNERNKSPHRVAAVSARTRLFRQLNPEKYAAHTAVSNAIRSGKLVKQPCVFCGASNTVGHHEDYSKPLDVIWMCQPHHVQYHLGYLQLPRETECA